jgi:dienelactone hydrolase
MTTLATPGRRPPAAGGRTPHGRPPAARGRTAGRREITAFRVAMALIALAVVDDAFLHPEQGAAAGDHVVSGLVPLALVIGLVLVHPRLRPGLRAIACLVCGTLAAVAGAADGVRHVAVDRVAGDDVTALLGGLAGVALIALGVAVLWRSRRRDDRVLRRWARRAAVAVVGLLAAYLLVLPTGIAIIATHKARSPVAAADLGRPYERVSLHTGDGHRLTAWYVPSRNGAAVIAFPGRAQPLPHARMLVRHGYGVLLLDRRGEGESDGDYNAFGWGGAADLAAGVRYLRARPDVETGRIGGLGLSVGGELLLETAAREPALRAVVAEGAGVRSLAEHLHTPGLGRVQRWLSNWVAQTGALAVLANAAPPDDLTDLAARIPPRPVLLIRASHGAGGEELNPVYREAADATLWRAQGGHTGALAAQTEEYERRVIGFFDRALR